MSIDVLLRSALTIAVLLAGSPWGVAADEAVGASVSPRADAIAAAGEAVDPTANPARDAAPVRVATAASAAMAVHALPPGPTQTQPGNDPPAALLVIAAVLVIVFVTTRRQKDR